MENSDIGFALTNPVKVSYKALIQVWDTTYYAAESGYFTFEYRVVTYSITPEVVAQALHLPTLNMRTPDNFSNETPFKLVWTLGYNGEVTKIENLFRTKLKKEWNFFLTE